MGWVWKDDEPDQINSSGSARKLKRFSGIASAITPVEVVQSNKEYTEDDVTDEVLKGSVSFGSSELGALDFPGLRSDIEAIERSFFGGLNNFFEAAEEMKNGFLI
ncbi:fra a 1-associated protein [Fagus crenata]